MTPREVIRRAVGYSFVNDLDPEVTTDSILSALEQAGMVVVPVEPSEKMMEASRSLEPLTNIRVAKGIYYAMLTAAKEG